MNVGDISRSHTHLKKYKCNVCQQWSHIVWTFHIYLKIFISKKRRKKNFYNLKKSKPYLDVFILEELRVARGNGTILWTKIINVWMRNRWTVKNKCLARCVFGAYTCVMDFYGFWWLWRTPVVFSALQVL